VARHSTHLCWSCGGKISPEQDEERVGGLKPHEIRYRHAGEADCHEYFTHMSTRRPGSPADPIGYLDDQRDEEGRYHAQLGRKSQPRGAAPRG